MSEAREGVDPPADIRICVVDEGDLYQELGLTWDQWEGVASVLSDTLRIHDRRLIADRECAVLSLAATRRCRELAGTEDDGGKLAAFAKICEAGSAGSGLLVWQP